MQETIIFNNYKSFNSTENRIPLSKINILIGRNNTGKSSIVDIIEYITDVKKFVDDGRLIGDLKVCCPIQQGIIDKVFSSGSSGGDIKGNHNVYGTTFVGKEAVISLRAKNTSSFESSLNVNENFDNPRELRAAKFWEYYGRSVGNPLSKYTVIRITAERDLVPEIDNSELACTCNGSGATNIIHKVINHNKYDSKLVEHFLLKALNTIMMPDSKYRDIVVQQSDGSQGITWEIYLEEDNGQRVALSKCGSGLKTVLLVLVNLILIPEIQKLSVRNIIFAFEELENNLHPALQKRLFEYISTWIVKNDSHVIFTTHSHIAINLFHEIENVNIMHVTKDLASSRLNNVFNTQHKYDVLNDLNIKASDILQSNGIIWVEGPSDRIYINKWLELMSESKVKENVHYQIMFYGGRLLSHLSFEVDENDPEISQFIDMLKLNRNVAVVIDSDKRKPRQHINKTKKRIQEEFEKIGAFCWITEGKEIENYLAPNVIKSVFESDKDIHFEKFTLIDNYLDQLKAGNGKKYIKDKVGYSKKLVEFIDEASLNQLDLYSSLKQLVNLIKKWND